ncbi:hypothetical protein L2E82_47630 [Cichorium intybus]|uniref:Uncharacterized protein n=1 Tax=Cichorium intybus TaxID=13427 RepID=A0ACB8Z064_CICIN|nr:hypothetical protein L2E82_47630 [Cichorium intybus]
MGVTVMEAGYIGWYHHGWWSGVAGPGMFRIENEKKYFTLYTTQFFATTEDQMGFHLDAGASFYLSCLFGYLETCLD